MSPLAVAGDAYLAAAGAAGMLRRSGRHRYVVGDFADEVGGERQLLFEYCDPGLLAEPRETEAVVRREVAAREPAPDAVLLRAPAGAVLAPPWRPYITYIRYAAAPPDRAGGAGGELAVVPADDSHREAIGGWLVQAFAAAGADRGNGAPAAALRSVADAVLDADDRHSIVAVAGGRAVGHATLLCERHDDVTDRPYVELLDVLVDGPADLRRAATSALVRAAAAHAGTLGRPLIGNVIHAAPGTAGGTAIKDSAAILRGLLATGWAVDHVYWRRPGRA